MQPGADRERAPGTRRTTVLGAALGKDHLGPRVVAEYRRSGSVRAAADHATVSLPSAYRILADCGAYRPAVPIYPASLVLEAERLYVEKGLSCRGVAARLARRFDPAPSQQWVFDHLRRRGVLRSKSESDRLMNARLNGKDYDALSEKARELAAERKLSVRRIADELGVSRNMVRRAVRKVDRCNPSRATVRRAWEADLPDVEERIDRRHRVAFLRLEHGLSHPEIARRLGIGRSTVFQDLKALGLVGSRSAPRRPPRASV